MPAKHEQDATQTAYLFELLDLQAQNPGVQINGMKKAIMRARASMTEPEIAWVERQIAETYKKET